MTTTVSYPYNPGASKHDAAITPAGQALFARYEEIAFAEELHWDTRYRKQRLLGAGGQGAVYLADRMGADGFVRPVALKVFSPETYRSDQSYLEDMARVGQVSAKVALIQSDNV